jgi:uncharacterized membrane protein
MTKNKRSKEKPETSPSSQKPLPSKNEIKEISQFIAQEIVAEKYSGPIPAPEALRQYGDIHPDFPDRIIQMAEQEMKHRHRMEEKELDADIDYNEMIAKREDKEILRGQVFAFLIGAITITCGTYATVKGHPMAGSFIGGTGVIGLVTAFILGRKGNTKYPEHSSNQEKENATDK